MAITLVFNLPLTANKNAGIELEATIAGINSGAITKELLMKAGEIKCTDQKYKVISFTLSLVKNRDLIELYGFGNKLNTLMKKVLLGVGPGHTMIVKDIIAKNDKGKKIRLPLIVLALN